MLSLWLQLTDGEGGWGHQTEAPQPRELLSSHPSGGLRGPLPVPSLISWDFLPVLSVSLAHCIALGKFLPSLSLYFPVGMLAPQDNTDLGTFRLCCPKAVSLLFSRQVLLPPTHPSILLILIPAFLHQLYPPCGTRHLSTYILPFLQEFAGKCQRYPPSTVYPKFIQAGPPPCGCGLGRGETHRCIFVCCSGSFWNACLFLFLPSELRISKGKAVSPPSD